jgi:hypothetical protein
MFSVICSPSAQSAGDSRAKAAKTSSNQKTSPASAQKAATVNNEVFQYPHRRFNGDFSTCDQPNKRRDRATLREFRATFRSTRVDFFTKPSSGRAGLNRRRDSKATRGDPNRFTRSLATILFLLSLAGGVSYYFGISELGNS